MPAIFCFTYEKELMGKHRKLVGTERHFDCSTEDGCKNNRDELIIRQVRNWPYGTQKDSTTNGLKHISTCAKWD